MIKNKITLDVLADINRKMKNGEYAGPDNRILVLFNGSNIDLASRIEEIKEIKEGGTSISLGFSFMGEGIVDRSKIIESLEPWNVYGEEDIFLLEKIVEENPVLLVPNITINSLAKVALGVIDSFASNLIWTYLYQGKSVYLDFNSVKYYLGKESKNKGIIALRDKYIKEILSLGAIEIEEGMYSKHFIEKKEIVEKKTDDTRNTEKSGNNSTFNNLLLERDLEKIERDSLLTLPAGTIITPLARDKAREKRIKIEIK